jgi:hypothetical protein
MRREDAKQLEIVFSYFAEKLRMEKLDDKLLEMRDPNTLFLNINEHPCKLQPRPLVISKGFFYLLVFSFLKDLLVVFVNVCEPLVSWNTRWDSKSLYTMSLSGLC